ncbi:MAG TPA: thiol:disulfide interchange protein DsbG [Gammaproteobacteria bacterium]|nr:thiol:disulfide interchange protein DsbG [Gammaproteobacteria bacterium]
MGRIVNGLAVALTIFAAAFVWSADASAAGKGPSGVHAGSQLAASMLADITQASWIAEGKGPHVVYVFFDPNCPYCHKLYEETRSWVSQGKLELRWIPVGVLTTTSEGKAAAMLGAKDPLKAFYQNENHYSRSGGGGGLEEGLAGPAIEKKLKANESLLARTGFGAVPTMLFRAKDGQAVLVQGSPPNDKLKPILDSVK